MKIKMAITMMMVMMVFWDFDGDCDGTYFTLGASCMC